MATMMNKPLSIGTIIKKSFNFYSLSFNRLLPFTISLAIFVPFYSLGISKINATASWADIATDPFNNPNLFRTVLCGILFFVVTLIIKCNMIETVGKIVQNENTSALQSLRTVFMKFVTIICSQIVLLAIIAVLSLLCYFIGKMSLTAIGIALFILCTIYLLVRFNFYIPLILFANTGIVNALTKSYHLTLNFWWRTFLLTALAALIHTPFIMASHLVSPSIGFILQFIETLVVLPLTLNILLFQFYDLELRQN